MDVLFRLLIAGISGVSTLFFVFWVGGALLVAAGAPFWLSTLFALGAGASVGRFVWTHTNTVQTGLATAVVLGAFAVGGLGFAGGFFGPLIFMPESNQGPLLGIFITGPLGFMLGAVGGAVYWAAWGRRPAGRR